MTTMDSDDADNSGGSECSDDVLRLLRSSKGSLGSESDEDIVDLPQAAHGAPLREGDEITFAKSSGDVTKAEWRGVPGSTLAFSKGGTAIVEKVRQGSYDEMWFFTDSRFTTLWAPVSAVAGKQNQGSASKTGEEAVFVKGVKKPLLPTSRDWPSRISCDGSCSTHNREGLRFENRSIDVDYCETCLLADAVDPALAGKIIGQARQAAGWPPNAEAEKAKGTGTSGKAPAKPKDDFYLERPSVKIYLNGECCFFAEDPVHLYHACDDGQTSSVWALDPTLGLSVFGQKQLKGSRDNQLRIRTLEISAATLTADEVRHRHTTLKVWQCVECHKFNGPSRRLCFHCKTRKRKSAPAPEKPLDTATGLFTVVTSTFQETVLRYAEQEDPVLLICLSDTESQLSNGGHCSLTRHQASLVALFARGFPMRVALINLADNELDLVGLDNAAKDTLLQASGLDEPFCILFRQNPSKPTQLVQTAAEAAQLELTSRSGRSVVAGAGSDDVQLADLRMAEQLEHKRQQVSKRRMRRYAAKLNKTATLCKAISRREKIPQVDDEDEGEEADGIEDEEEESSESSDEEEAESSDDDNGHNLQKYPKSSSKACKKCGMYGPSTQTGSQCCTKCELCEVCCKKQLRCQAADGPKGKHKNVKRAKKEPGAAIEIGSKVMVKEGKAPSMGWGAVKPESVGVVKQVNKDDSLVIDFPEQSHWNGRVEDMDVVSHKGTREKLGKEVKSTPKGQEGEAPAAPQKLETWDAYTVALTPSKMLSQCVQWLDATLTQSKTDDPESGGKEALVAAGASAEPPGKSFVAVFARPKRTAAAEAATAAVAASATAASALGTGGTTIAFGDHRRAMVATYWERLRIPDRVHQLREDLLATRNRRATSMDATAFQRYLSMWLSDPRNFSVDGEMSGKDDALRCFVPTHALEPLDSVLTTKEAEADWEAKLEKFERELFEQHDRVALSKEESADVTASFRQQWERTTLREEKARRAALDAVARRVDLGELVESELYGANQPGLTATERLAINAVLREMLIYLQEELPTSKLGQVLCENLLSRPVVCADAECLREVNGMMTTQEMARQWPMVVSVIQLPSSSILQAIEATLKPLLRGGLSPDAAPYGYPILYLACAQGSLEVVRVLLLYGANLQLRSKDGTTAVEVAAAMGHTDIVELLIGKGAHFGSALHLAAASGQVLVVDRLLRMGMHIDIALEAKGATSSGGSPLEPLTPLTLAVMHQHSMVVKMLRTAGASLDAVPLRLREGHTMLMEDAERDSQLMSEMGEQQLEAGAVSFFRVARYVAQRKLADIDRDEHLVHLVDPSTKEPLDPDSRDALGWTGLMYAALADDGLVASKYLRLGAKPQAVNRRGLSALLWAWWHRSDSFLRAVAEAGHDTQMDQRDVQALTHLQLVASNNSGVKAAMSILERGGTFREVPVGARKPVLHNPSTVVTPDEPSSELSEGRSEGADNTQRSATDFAGEEQPSVSLEEWLLQLNSRFGKSYPSKGQFKGDMPGFVRHIKVAVVDILASQEYPDVLLPMDILALHLYTRAELFYMVNHALRSNDPEELRLWKPVAWYIEAAKKKLARTRTVLFRGVTKWLKADRSGTGIFPVESYRPGMLVTWGGFSSATEDHRIASKFMYGTQDAASVEGVIFKIRTRTSSPIMWSSYVPQEAEQLFGANSMFRVLHWYAATDLALRQGVDSSQRLAGPFVLNCQHLVKPIPLATDLTVDDLYRQLDKNKRVLVIEMEEIVPEVLR